MKVQVKVTITTEDGEVLDQFKLGFTEKEETRSWPNSTPAHVANNVRNTLEHIYEVEDN
jgi:hypothetical protein